MIALYSSATATVITAANSIVRAKNTIALTQALTYPINEWILSDVVLQ